MKVLLTRLALWWINRQLMSDPGYYQAWKANIAISIFDEIEREGIMRVQPSFREYLHRACNNGADRFLALLRK
jgi:hypothetical protein